MRRMQSSVAAAATEARVVTVGWGATVVEKEAPGTCNMNRE